MNLGDLPERGQICETGSAKGGGPGGRISMISMKIMCQICETGGRNRRGSPPGGAGKVGKS